MSDELPKDGYKAPRRVGRGEIREQGSKFLALIEPVANDDHPGDFGSPPNVISLCPPPFSSSVTDLNYAMIRALFAVPVRGACVAVRARGGRSACGRTSPGVGSGAGSS